MYAEFRVSGIAIGCVDVNDLLPVPGYLDFGFAGP
jgi:hypothetical protein